MKRILIDTDIGDDVDDALALAFASALTGIELVGVTTVHARTDIRSRLAAKVLAAAGRFDVPVATGISHPLKREPYYQFIEKQSQALEDGEAFESIIGQAAPAFMADVIKNAPRPLTLVAIGPLTNVAHLFREHPECVSKLEELVVMGGLFSRPGHEYNILVDPEAAQEVFESGVPTRVVPLEVTEQCLMPEEMLAAIGRDTRPLGALLERLIHLWQEQNDRTYPVLYDPVTLGYLVAPDLFKWRPCAIEVILDHPEFPGMTKCHPDAFSSVHVCTEVDYAGFLDLFTTHVLGDAMAELSGEEPL